MWRNKILVILHFFLLVFLVLLLCTCLVPVQSYTNIARGKLSLLPSFPTIQYSFLAYHLSNPSINKNKYPGGLKLFVIVLAEILPPLKPMVFLQLVSAKMRFHSQCIKVTSTAHRGS